MALLQRQGNDLLTRHIDLLRECVRTVRAGHPFHIHPWVVLPDHLHCVIELPPGDADFATRWRLIKMAFSKALPHGEARSTVQIRRGERKIWQRPFWEHLIRDETDYRAHMDYVHINPLKHGLVERVVDGLIDIPCARRARGVYAGLWWMMVPALIGSWCMPLLPPTRRTAQCPLCAPLPDQPEFASTRFGSRHAADQKTQQGRMIRYWRPTMRTLRNAAVKRLTADKTCS